MCHKRITLRWHLGSPLASPSRHALHGWGHGPGGSCISRCLQPQGSRKVGKSSKVRDGERTESSRRRCIEVSALPPGGGTRESCLTEGRIYPCTTQRHQRRCPDRHELRRADRSRARGILTTRPPEPIQRERIVVVPDFRLTRNCNSDSIHFNNCTVFDLQEENQKAGAWALVRVHALLRGGHIVDQGDGRYDQSVSTATQGGDWLGLPWWRMWTRTCLRNFKSIYSME